MHVPLSQTTTILANATNVVQESNEKKKNSNKKHETDQKEKRIGKKRNIAKTKMKQRNIRDDTERRRDIKKGETDEIIMQQAYNPIYYLQVLPRQLQHAGNIANPGSQNTLHPLPPTPSPVRAYCTFNAGWLQPCSLRSALFVEFCFHPSRRALSTRQEVGVVRLFRPKKATYNGEMRIRGLPDVVI